MAAFKVTGVDSEKEPFGIMKWTFLPCEKSNYDFKGNVTANE